MQPNFSKGERYKKIANYQRKVHFSLFFRAKNRPSRAQSTEHSFLRSECWERTKIILIYIIYILYILVITFVKNFRPDSIAASKKLCSVLCDTFKAKTLFKTPILTLNRLTDSLLPNDRPFSSFGRRIRENKNTMLYARNAHFPKKYIFCGVFLRVLGELSPKLRENLEIGEKCCTFAVSIK